MTNNADWMRGVGCVEFLRDVGRFLTVNYMTAKDSVRSRLESDAGISYTEFSYMLLQAFDFVHLERAYGCRLRVGDSDQYGNITAGCEPSRRCCSTRTRPGPHHHYWLDRTDEEVPRLLEMFSLRRLDLHANPRAELARVMTAWVHGT